MTAAGNSAPTGRPLGAAALALAVALAGLLPWLGRAPLGDPSEARYAVVAAGMARTGDWLTPRLDGLLHFTKPPLAYWMGAAGVRLAGVADEFALRAAVALLGAALAALVALIAGELGVGRLAAPLWLATSPGFLVMGRLLLTDMPLALAVALFYLPMARLAGVRDRLAGAERLLIALAAAAGFLAKGPVFFLWTLLPWAVLARVSPHWRARASSGWRLPYALGLLATAPWFVLNALRHPGLWKYFALNQSLRALVGGREFHTGTPVVFYLPALLLLTAGFWPALAAARGAPRSPARALLAAWALPPLALLALIPAKHETYILPLAPALALLAASGRARCGRAARLWCAAVPALLAAGFLAAQWLAFAAPPEFPGAAKVRRAAAAKYLEADASALAQAAGPASTLVLVEMNPPSLFFYLGRPLPLIKPTIAGRFVNDEPAPTFFPERHATLEEFWARCDRPVLLFYRHRFAFFAARHPEARIVFESRRFLALAPDPGRPRVLWRGAVRDPEDAARGDLRGGRGAVGDYCPLRTRPRR